MDYKRVWNAVEKQYNSFCKGCDWVEECDTEGKKYCGFFPIRRAYRETLGLDKPVDKKDTECQN